jgi:uracil phosphoribosyltransferase
MTSPNVKVIDHPLLKHKLTLLRQKERSTNSFRTLISEISMLLAYEVTHDLPLIYEEIETPLAKMRSC